MSRTDRLLQLMQILRRCRQPVTAHQLATELNTSVRTIYRDMATLTARGVCIAGAAGVGYQLRPGAVLPPMAFTEDELDAVVLGLRLVAQRGDGALARAAADARAKIEAVLSPQQRSEAEHSGLLAGPSAPDLAMTEVREALRRQRKLLLHYTNQQGCASTRVVWPIALAFFDQAHVLVGWCESRAAFRSFRLDRIAHQELREPYPKARRALLAEWRRQEGVPEQA